MAKVKTVASFDTKNPEVLDISWGDGVKSQYRLSELDPVIRAFGLWHGIKQLTMDTHSGTYKETGSIAACREVSDAKWESLKSGEIYRERGANPWIFEALSEIWDCEVEEAVEAFGKLPEATQKALFETKEVKKWKAERDLARADAMESKLDPAALFTKEPAKAKK